MRWNLTEIAHTRTYSSWKWAVDCMVPFSIQWQHLLRSIGTYFQGMLLPLSASLHVRLTSLPVIISFEGTSKRNFKPLKTDHWWIEDQNSEKNSEIPEKFSKQILEIREQVWNFVYEMMGKQIVICSSKRNKKWLRELSGNKMKSNVHPCHEINYKLLKRFHFCVYMWNSWVPLLKTVFENQTATQFQVFKLPVFLKDDESECDALSCRLSC
jgi:hypothetical protein